jgi:hypothetical protein
MQSGNPVVLPDDYKMMWSSELADKGKQVGQETTLSNPFSDYNEATRVTASGFTDLDIAESNLFEAIRHSEDLSERERRRKPRSSWIRGWQAESSKGNDSGVDSLDTKDYNAEIRNKILDIVGDRLTRDGESREGKLPTKIDNGMDFLVGLGGQGVSVTDETGSQDEPEAHVLKQGGRASGHMHGAKNDTQDKYVTMSDFTRFTEQLNRQIKSMSIAPSDSISQVNRNRMPVLSEVRQNTELSQLTMIREDSSSAGVDSTVIGGYNMTSSEKIREVDAHVNVKPVRGLPIMFTNPRLNFLTHIHSSLFNLLREVDTGKYPTLRSLEILMASRRSWDKSPECQLLETVLDSTFDPVTFEVVSNPFKLPVLEPTMKMTPAIMVVCLDQLHNEFEQVWFESMKLVTMPIFQSKYDDLKYRQRPRRRSSVETGPMTSSSSSKSRKSRRSSGSDSRSVLSEMFLGK